jgi:hypothetical protein
LLFKGYEKNLTPHKKRTEFETTLQPAFTYLFIILSALANPLTCSIRYSYISFTPLFILLDTDFIKKGFPYKFLSSGSNQYYELLEVF